MSPSENLAFTIRWNRRVTLLVRVVVASFLLLFMAPAVDAFAVPAVNTVVAAPAGGPMPLAPDNGPVNHPATPASRCSDEDSTVYTPVSIWGTMRNGGARYAYEDLGVLQVAGRTTNAVVSGINRVVSIPSQFGHAFWGWSAQLAGLSSDFCPLVSMGKPVDTAAASIARMVVGDGEGTAGSIGVLLVTVSVAIGLLAMRRRGGSIGSSVKLLIAPLIAAACLVVMANGATHSQMQGGTFVPGPGSPTWVLLKTSQTMSAIERGALNSMNLAPDDIQYADGRAEAAKIPGSCVSQVDNWYNNKWSFYAGPSPAAISRMWERSVLPAYIEDQFGSADNAVGWAVYCRYFDAQSGSDPGAGNWGRLNASPNETLSLYDGSGNLAMTLNSAGENSGARFGWQSDDKARDAALNGWLVCRPTGPNTFTVAEGAELIFKTPPTSEDCLQWWGKGTDGQPVTDVSMVKSLSTDNVKKRDELNAALVSAPNDQSRDLVEAYIATHDVRQMGSAPGMAVLLSGMTALVVYGGLALVTMGAKIGLVVMALFVVVALIAGMWAGQSHRMVSYIKRTLGLVFITIAGQALFALVTGLAMIIIAMGEPMLGGTTLFPLWGAIAPLLAVMLLHFGTKAVFGHSPFNVRGMKKLATEGIDPAMLAIGTMAASPVASMVRGRRSSGASETAESRAAAGTGKAAAGTGSAPPLQDKDGSKYGGHRPAGEGPEGAQGVVPPVGVPTGESRGAMRRRLVKTHEAASRAARARTADGKRIDPAGLAEHDRGKLRGFDEQGKALKMGDLAGMSRAERQAMHDQRSADKIILEEQKRMQKDAVKQSRADQRKQDYEALVAQNAAEGKTPVSEKKYMRRRMVTDRAKQVGVGAKQVGVGAWQKATSNDGARGLARNTARAGMGAVRWAGRNKRKVALGVLASTGVGVPAAIALGAGALGAKVGIVRGVTAGVRGVRRRITSDGHAARVEADRILAQQALQDEALRAWLSARRVDDAKDLELRLARMDPENQVLEEIRAERRRRGLDAALARGAAIDEAQQAQISEYTGEKPAEVDNEGGDQSQRAEYGTAQTQPTVEQPQEAELTQAELDAQSEAPGQGVLPGVYPQSDLFGTQQFGVPNQGVDAGGGREYDPRLDRTAEPVERADPRAAPERQATLPMDADDVQAGIPLDEAREQQVQGTPLPEARPQPGPAQPEPAGPERPRVDPGPGRAQPEPARPEPSTRQRGKRAATPRTDRATIAPQHPPRHPATAPERPASPIAARRDPATVRNQATSTEAARSASAARTQVPRIGGDRQ